MISMYKLLFLFVICFSLNASAKVRSLNVNEISSYSDVIVIAEIVSLRTKNKNEKIAKTKAIEVLKGEIPNEFEFGASPSWECDISHAISGESVLLFLNRVKGKKIYSVAHSGRGYMPIRVIANKKYIAVPLDVKVPEDAPKIQNEKNEHFSNETIELEYVTSKINP